MKIPFAIIALSLILSGSSWAVESLNPVDQLPALVSTSEEEYPAKDASPENQTDEESANRQPRDQGKETKTNPSN